MDWFIKIFSLLASIATIVGVCIAIPQISIANKQLKEINSFSQILSRFAQLEIKDSGIIKTINFRPTAVNIGSFETDEWNVKILFRDNVGVNQVGTEWKYKDKVYIYSSNSRLLSLRNDPRRPQGGGAFDTIGSFTISIPSSKTALIPIALIITNGYKTKSEYTQVFFDSVNKQFMYRYNDDVNFNYSDFSDPKDLNVI